MPGSRGREIDSGHHLAEDNPTAVAAAIIEHCWLPSSPRLRCRTADSDTLEHLGRHC